MSDPVAALARLGDDLRRAQQTMGVSPELPDDPVYEQNHEAREREAVRRLRELGYWIPPRRGPAEALDRFRDEAALARAGARTKAGLDGRAWGALDELRGLEARIDPARWREGGEGEWLPAMRRALRARVEELVLPDTPARRRPRDAPSPAEVRDLLERVEFAMPGSRGPSHSTRALEDRLVPTLLNHERLQATVRAGLQQADPPGPLLALAAELRGVEEELLGLPKGGLEPESKGRPLAQLRARVEARRKGRAGARAQRREGGRRVFRELVERPELRAPPSREELLEMWPALTLVLEEHAQAKQQWAELTADTKQLFRGRERAGAWLRGAGEIFGERNQSLRAGLRELAEDRDPAVRKATLEQSLRLIHHGVSEAFAIIHLAAARFVAFVRGPEPGPITFAIGLRRSRVLVEAGVGPEQVEAFLAARRRDDRGLAISAEILGLSLGLTMSWAQRPLPGPRLLLAMAKRVPELLRLGAELRALRADQ